MHPYDVSDIVGKQIFEVLKSFNNTAEILCHAEKFSHAFLTKVILPTANANNLLMTEYF